ncbi:MAG: class I SAM-dependent methyltransferase [Smithella sp.]|nr:class I SAM-dependent methyltransferase [Smithella sp.]
MQTINVDLERAQFFDDLSDRWDTSGPSPDAKEVLTFLKKLKIDSGKTVLDVGTGTGMLIPHIFSFDPGNVIALDLAERMLEKLHKKYAPRFGSKLEISQQDVHKLDIDDATVDIIICNGVYPHFHDKPLALSQLRRVLKTGGTLAINHFAGREFVNKVHGSSAHPLIRQDLLDPVTILKETIACSGFSLKEWRDDATEYYLIAEKS